MGYSIRNTIQTLKALDYCANNKNIKHICFFALDDRPSNKEKIDKLNGCLLWIDQLSAERNIVTLIFARTETQYAADFRPYRFESWGVPEIHQAKEELMAVNTLYINPTFLIAQSLGLQTDELPAVILFDTSTANKRAKYRKIPVEVFESISKLESFLPTLYKSLDLLEDWETLEFDIEYFRLKCQEIIEKTKPVEVWRNFHLPFEERKSIKIFISYAATDLKYAEKIHENLKEVGFDPWMDVHNLTGGELWNEQINKRLEEVDFVITCLSKESVDKRGYIQHEFKRALELWEYKLKSDIFIIPVILDDCEIPTEFKKFHCINYSYGEGLLRIVYSIEEGIKRRRK